MESLMSLSTENGESIDAWVTATFGTYQTDSSIVVRANHEMAELITAAHACDRDKTLEEAADVIITLNRLFHRNGTTMQEQVDRKMQINRKRQWHVVNGHGRHVEGT
jgi:phosphoribosyl-ATP pyrophosphohydrolase